MNGPHDLRSDSWRRQCANRVLRILLIVGSLFFLLCFLVSIALLIGIDGTPTATRQLELVAAFALFFSASVWFGTHAALLSLGNSIFKEIDRLDRALTSNGTEISAKSLT